MKVITGKFFAWFLSQTRLMRYFIIALLFHVLILAVVGSMKIVAVIPRIVAAFEGAPLPPLPEAEPDPFAAYRDFDYTGPTLGGGGGTGGKGPGGVPTAGGGTPEEYQAHILTPSAQAGPESVSEVIGVLSDTATAIARPAGGPSGIGLTAMTGLGPSAIGTVGIKGPGGGLLNARMGPQRSQALQKFRGSAETEKAVLAALRWLKANQRADGSWKCHVSDEAGTALAALAFLGHGETPDSPEFGQAVNKALQFLVSHVDNEGLVFGRNMYAQGVVLLALSEGYAMTQSPALKEPLDRVVRAVIKSQGVPKKEGKFAGGWRYTPVSDDSDTSVSGWLIMGLKSARNAGIEIPQTVFDRASDYLWRMYDSGNPGFSYNGGGRTPAMTAVGVLCQQFMGHADDRRVKGALDYLKDQKVEWDKTKGDWVIYGWYYMTQAMFQGGGQYWQYWNREIRDTMVKNQLPDGRWPPPQNSENENKDLAKTPVYATALGALILEVYYRYLPLYQLMEEGAKE